MFNFRDGCEDSNCWFHSRTDGEDESVMVTYVNDYAIITNARSAEIHPLLRVVAQAYWRPVLTAVFYVGAQGTLADTLKVVNKGVDRAVDVYLHEDWIVACDAHDLLADCIEDGLIEYGAPGSFNKLLQRHLVELDSVDGV